MRRSAILVFALLLFLAAGEVHASGNANFILGIRSLGDELWDGLDADRQGLFGVNVDFGGKEWPVRLWTALHASAHSDSDAAIDQVVAVAELSFGFVWIGNRDGAVQPYIGAGLSSVGAAIDLDLVDDNDQTFGFFADGGVFFRLGKRFNIGVDVRVVRGTEVELFGAKTDVDYEQIGLILGFGW